MIATRTSSRWLALLVAGGLLTSGAAAKADKDSSAQHYKEGKAAYSAGNFAEAIEHFEAAYGEFPAPAYLYNIAQAHRKLGHCREALEHYRRFVVAKPDSPQTPTIRGYIAELEATCPSKVDTVPVETAEVEEVDDTNSSDVVASDTPPAQDTSSGAEDTSLTKTVPRPPPPRDRLLLNVRLGSQLHRVDSVVTPVTPALQLAAYYPLALGPVRLGLGAQVQLTRMPYETAMDEAALSFAQLAPGLQAELGSGSVRAHLGAHVGAIMVGSVQEGSPFAPEGAEGAVQLVGAGNLGVDYWLSKRLSIGIDVQAQLTSVPEGWSEDIGSVRAVQFSGGLGYRL